MTESAERQRVRHALDQLKPYLAAFVGQHLPAMPRMTANAGEDLDVQGLLRQILGQWTEVFSRVVPRHARSYVHELVDIRNRWAHEQLFTVQEAQRAVDTANLVARAIGAPALADAIQRPAGAPLRAAAVPSLERWISDPSVLLRIARSYKEGMSAEALFEATRGVWRVSTMRERARFALPVAENRILEVFEIECWLPAGTSEYKGRRFSPTEIAGRWEFLGRVADEAVRSRYVGQSVEAYFPKGAMNPVAYALNG